MPAIMVLIIWKIKHHITESCQDGGYVYSKSRKSMLSKLNNETGPTGAPNHLNYLYLSA
jgi:hypothetical protein